MNQPVNNEPTPCPHSPGPLAPKLLLDRRRLLQISAALGGAAFLTGCAGGRRASAALPGPVWPHEEPQLPQASATIATPQQQVYVPPPQPQPVPAPASPSISVIPRSAWAKGQPRMQFSKPMRGVTRITVHHDANNAVGLSGGSAITARLNSIREAHLRRGSTWVDIGYHYIVDPDGRVWEGRPIAIEGAHVADTNDHNLGVMLLGNFEQHRPTQAQLDMMDRFLAEQMRVHNVGLGRVYTHQELKPTECPGRNLQWYMRQTRAGRGRLAMMA
ncbi:MAG: peptidoglycan recognition family protein [Phycisphaerales bacterium]